MTTCWGQWCGHMKTEAYKWFDEAVSLTQWPPRVETDCGDYCAAFSWLHPKLPITPFSFNGFQTGIMLIFDANEEMWNEVQCMSVTDCMTSTRACCSCSDPWYCPWPGYTELGFDPGGYCSFDAPGGKCMDDTCKALAAGCGVSLYDLGNQANGLGGGQWGRPGNTDWGDQACNQQDVQSGNCGVCRSPMWCDDENTTLGNWGSIRTPQEWIDEFFDRDGGEYFGVRQCRYKGSQHDLFLRTMERRFEERHKLPFDWLGRQHDHANNWNEVNMYVDKDDPRLAEVVYRNLLGIVYVRPPYGEWPKQRDEVRWLRAHWRSIGVQVPIFAMDAEELEKVQKWTPGSLVDLLDPAYNFVELEDED